MTYFGRKLLMMMIFCCCCKSSLYFKADVWKKLTLCFLDFPCCVTWNMSVLLSWQYSTTTVWLRDRVKEMLCCPLLWTACNSNKKS